LPDYLASNPSPSRFERIAAINQYLSRQGPAYPFQTAEQLLLGHDNIPTRDTDIAQLENPVNLDKDLRYRAALKGKAKLRDAVIALMDSYGLDALIYPHKLHGPLKLGHRSDPERQYKPNQLSPVTGLPAMIVPMGFTPDGLPVGLEILGRPWSEPTLIKIASGFEAVTHNTRLPESTPSLPGESIPHP
ncbi:MAG: hypothetical protein LR011_02425, partial [Verrucomicrobia bacterium]|nr:hypothetical protein [Verrucomicrobiota bacterium]